MADLVRAPQGSRELESDPSKVTYDALHTPYRPPTLPTPANGLPPTRKRHGLSWSKRLLFSLGLTLGLAELCSTPYIEPFGRLKRRHAIECNKPYVPFCYGFNERENPGVDLNSTNSEGYREIETPSSNHAHTEVILAYGGSTSEGPRSATGGYRADYPYIATRMLNAANEENESAKGWGALSLGFSRPNLTISDSDVFVLNHAMGGYSLFENVEQVLHELMIHPEKKKPRAVIISECFNFALYGKVEGNKPEPQGFDRYRPLFPGWNLYNAFRGYGFAIRKGVEIDTKAPSSHQYGYGTRFSDFNFKPQIDALKRARALTEPNGIRLILGAHPDAFRKPEPGEILIGHHGIYNPVVVSTDQAYAETWTLKRGLNAAIRRYSEENGIPFIDWEDTMDRFVLIDGASFKYTDNGHLEYLLGNMPQGYGLDNAVLTYQGNPVQFIRGRGSNPVTGAAYVPDRLVDGNGQTIKSLEFEGVPREMTSTKERFFGGDWMHWNEEASPIMGMEAAKVIRQVLGYK